MPFLIYFLAREIDARGSLLAVAGGQWNPPGWDTLPMVKNVRDALRLEGFGGEVRMNLEGIASTRHPQLGTHL